MRFLKNLGLVTVVVCLLSAAIIGGISAFLGIVATLAFYVLPAWGIAGVVGIIIVLLIFALAAVATMDETSEF